MAPGQPKKRASDEAKPASNGNNKTTTPELQRSPIKQRKMGITLRQKQALIDNLQLESEYPVGRVLSAVVSR